MIMWLASYPRSGNTLVRIALKRFFALPTTSLYTGEDFLSAALGGPAPDMTLEQIARSVQPWIVKTHEMPGDDCYPAMYLVRDGRDALISYAHYVLHTDHGIPIGGDREAFLKVLRDLIVSTGHFGGWSRNV